MTIVFMLWEMGVFAIIFLASLILTIVLYSSAVYSLLIVFLYTCAIHRQKTTMGKVIETVTDSIAIEILDKDNILVGKGNELHLYSKNTAKDNVFDTRVLSIKLTNKVHGIKKNENRKDEILLVYGEKEFILVEYKDAFKFYEMYRAELSDWISCGLFFIDSKEFVLLTAHSTILRFSYEMAERKCILKERVTCVDKSTLYCSHLFGVSWSELIVFGGNAFGEILIWQPTENIANADSSKPKVSPLIHRVSAHNGVIFSIDYNQKSQYLITTSDDRSLKWWKIEFAHHANWKDSSLKPLSSCYGHVARVFKGRIIKKGSRIFALSVGEDSFFCVWNNSGQLVFKKRHQYGAVIWNFAFESHSTTIYTVGSTGNLMAFGLTQVFNEAENPKSDFLLPAISDKNPVEYIAKLKFLNQNLLVALTNYNNLMTARFNGQKWLSWEYSATQVGFKSTVMEVYQNIVAICGYKRLVLLEKQENSENFSILYDKEISDGVIRTFVFFGEHKYLICNDQGSCIIFSKSFETKHHLQLPQCREPWLTAALLLNQQQHIVASNRQGNLLLYQRQQATDKYELKGSIKHPHGNLGATQLLCIEESSATALIKSTGHDGAFNVVSVDLVNSTLQTCTRNRIVVTWVECIEKFENLDLFLGFNDNHFVVWCKEYDFLLQIPCGGGHRCWHFAINPKTESIHLAFIKSKRVRFHKLPLFNKELTTLPVARRWHVAPCNAMEILQHSPDIVVTAGEDNLLKIHTFDEQSRLRQQAELQSHISSIRCIKLKRSSSNEFLVFSGGGRAQLCVSEVHSRSFHVTELISYTLRAEPDNIDKTTLYNFDPETRLMSLDVKVLNRYEYEVYVGCSDGFIRHLKLDLQNKTLTTLRQYFYGKCILQIRYLEKLNIVVAAATDGYLNFFDSKILKCLHQIKHHSSGVNCLAVFYNVSNQQLSILSGGDDQGVSCTELSLHSELEITRKLHLDDVHSAQVCACAISCDGLYGFTSGVDQVLNKIDLRTSQVVEDFHSCIADIKGLALAGDEVCFLYGCGLQIYSFKS